MQHNLRDPSRDHGHGRIYRVTYEGRPLLKPAPIAGEPIERLLELLKEPEDRVRYRAKIELSGRNSDDVIAALTTWIDGLDTNGPHVRAPDDGSAVGAPVAQPRRRGAAEADAAFAAIRGPRAAATRVLCYWRDRVPDALELLKTRRPTDAHPAVRLEAVRAASFFQTPDAVAHRQGSREGFAGQVPGLRLSAVADHARRTGEEEHDDGERAGGGEHDDHGAAGFRRLPRCAATCATRGCRTS